jgi:hypothetical protein
VTRILREISTMIVTWGENHEPTEHRAGEVNFMSTCITIAVPPLLVSGARLFTIQGIMAGNEFGRFTASRSRVWIGLWST